MVRNEKDRVVVTLKHVTNITDLTEALKKQILSGYGSVCEKQSEGLGKLLLKLHLLVPSAQKVS